MLRSCKIWDVVVARCERPIRVTTCSCTVFFFPGFSFSSGVIDVVVCISSSMSTSLPPWLRWDPRCSCCIFPSGLWWSFCFLPGMYVITEWSSSFLTTRPYHFTRFSVIFVDGWVNLVVPLIYSFLVWSFFVTLHIHLNILVSFIFIFAFIFCYCPDLLRTELLVWICFFLYLPLQLPWYPLCRTTPHFSTLHPRTLVWTVITNTWLLL